MNSATATVQTNKWQTVSLSTTLANLTSVVGGELLLRIANFLAAIVIARRGGLVVFGFYAAALAYSTIATMLADNGLQVAVVREIANTPGQADSILSRAYVSKLILSVPMILALAGVGYFSQLSTEAWYIATLVASRTVLQSFCQLQLAALKGLGRMKGIGYLQGVHAAVLGIGLAACQSKEASVETALLILIGAQSLELVGEMLLLLRNGIRPAPVELLACYRLLTASTSVGMSFALANVVLRIDVIVLSSIVGVGGAGIFAAAQTPITFVYVVAWLTGSVLLPEMTRISGATRDLRLYVWRWTRLVLLAVVPLTALGIVIGPPIMTTLFGRKFEGAGALFQIMLAATPFILLTSIHINHAIAVRATRIYLGVYVGCAVLALALDVAAVRAFGTVGLAIAVLVRELSMAVVLVSASWLRMNRVLENPSER